MGCRAGAACSATHFSVYLSLNCGTHNQFKYEMNNNPPEMKEAIRAELEETRSVFHALLDALSEDDLSKPSHNPGWTNGEILAHMTFGFIVVNALLPLVRVWGRFPRWTSKPFAGLLNALTVPFNWVNGLGARMQARVFTYERVGSFYDRAHFALIKQMESVEPDEWERGMYYPTRWDANFGDFMTISKLFHYPVLHFNFHKEQLQYTGSKFTANNIHAIKGRSE